MGSSEERSGSWRMLKPWKWERRSQGIKVHWRKRRGPKTEDLWRMAGREMEEVHRRKRKARRGWCHNEQDK